jgi:hypothetical protein
MATRQLRCRDLGAGDILLKLSDGSLVNRAISFGQSLVGQRNAPVVHAGVMFDSTYIIEASGAGVSANDLRVGNLRHGYLAFRPKNRVLGKGAGTFAKILFDVHGRQGNLRYTIPGAIGSLAGVGGRPKTREEMDGLIDGILDGRTHPYFCSQLVVMVYQFVAEQNGTPAKSIFPFADPKVSPSELAKHLNGSASFDEIGYLMPQER